MTNYWSKKDTELKALVESRKLELPTDSTRKEVVDALKLWDIKHGEGTALVEQNEDGTLVDETVEEQAKEERLDVTFVKFHNTNNDASPFIFIGHNGKGWYIPYETELAMPNFLLESCIKDAVEEHLYQVEVQPNVYELRTRKIQRFPYSVIRNPANPNIEEYNQT